MCFVNVTKKNNLFHNLFSYQSAFGKLKKNLTKAPILAGFKYYVENKIEENSSENFYARVLS